LTLDRSSGVSKRHEGLTKLDLDALTEVLYIGMPTSSIISHRIRRWYYYL
jgi:hypothetical protein